MLRTAAPVNRDHADPAAWEPTASIVISGAAAIAGAIGLVIAGSALSGSQQGGMEHLGEFVLMLAAMGGTLAASVIGMIAAGIGMIRSSNRGVRTPALKVTLGVNLAEFWLVFLLPTIMSQI